MMTHKVTGQIQKVRHSRYSSVLLFSGLNTEGTFGDGEKRNCARFKRAYSNFIIIDKV